MASGTVSAMRIVWGGVKLAWVLLPSSSQDQIRATAMAYLREWVRRLECDIVGTPIVEIAEAAIETEAPIDIAKLAFTVLARVTEWDIPGLLWFRWQVGDKDLWQCSYTTDLDKAKICAIRLYQKLLQFESTVPGMLLVDSFVIGFRFRKPGAKGPKGFIFLPRETLTRQTMATNKTGKELDDEFKTDDEAKDHVCYGFFAIDYCEPPEPVTGPLLIPPAPKLVSRCGRFPQVAFVGSKGGPPFYNNYIGVKHDPKLPVPSKIRYRFLSYDKKGNSFWNGASYEVDYPIPAVREFFTDNDKSVEFLIDPWNPGYENIYYIPARGIIQGTITEILRRDEYIIGLQDLPDRWGERIYHFYEATIPPNYINVDTGLLHQTQIVPEYVVVEARFYYDEVFAEYEFGYGKPATIRIGGCSGSSPEPQDPDKKPCKKGWRLNGLCLHYEPCSADLPGLSFDICGQLSGPGKGLSATVNLPTGEDGTAQGSISFKAGEDLTVSYKDPSGAEHILVGVD